MRSGGQRSARRRGDRRADGVRRGRRAAGGVPGQPREEAVAARSTAALAAEDVGGEVALLFEGGDPARPLVIGPLLRPAGERRRRTSRVVRRRRRGSVLELRAEREIVLRCGKASITLTRAGKVLIRGAYISSAARPASNRIKGGSVQLN